MYAAISCSSLSPSAATGAKIASIAQGSANANHFPGLGYTSERDGQRPPARRSDLDLSRGTSIALAVSALLAASGCGNGGEEASDSASQPIQCEGGNACRGLSECATQDGKSSCVGENACKGTGYVYTQTQEQCEALQIRNRP